MKVTTPDASLPSYGLLAEFERREDLLHAVRTAQERGYRMMEAYTPHPVEEVSRQLGYRNHLPLVVLLCGIGGALTGLALQYYACVVDYPVHVAGKPAASWPSFVVVCFELTILFAALGAVIGMFVLNRLPRPHHPVFNASIFEQASGNRFFLVLLAKDPRFDESESSRFLEELEALQVVDVPLS